MAKIKKESISINVHVGQELFDMLSQFCSITGQSKTVAVERAIIAYCDHQKGMIDPNDGAGDVS